MTVHAPCRASRAVVLHRFAGFALSTVLLASSTAVALPGVVVSKDGRAVLLEDGRALARSSMGVFRDVEAVTVPGSESGCVSWTREEGGTTWREAALSVNGWDFAEPRVVDGTLHLRYAAFDPVAGEPEVPAALRAGPDTGLYIVQFNTPILPAYHAAVTEAGGSVHQYLPSNAYIVRVNAPEALAAIEGMGFVRSVVAYHPAYRLDEQVRAALFPVEESADGRSDERRPTRYMVQVLDNGMEFKQPVADRIALLGGEVNNLPRGEFLITATLTRDQLALVLRMDEVLWVDLWTPVEPDMDLVRALEGANWVRDNLGFTGQGVRGEVIDLGLRTTHVDFQNPAPLIHGGNSGDTSHGTNTYGIVFGRGVANALGLGLLPGAEQGIFADSDLVTDRWTHTQELVAPDGPYRAVLQSSSVGNTRTTAYTSISSATDDWIFDHGLLALQSQSNAGNQNSRPQAWAKNIVSVGAVNHYNNVNNMDDCWCGGASTGPAADGRIKPDLASYYDAIYTTSNSSNNSYTTGFGGTSAATPITAGQFGLMFQMWHEGVFGQNGRGPSVFESRPKFTTAKALMINTARQYSFSGQGASNNRFRQGWGVADVRSVYEVGRDAFIVNETDILAPTASVTYEFAVPAGAPFLKATMVYADPAGTTSSTIHRINDLTLRVTSPTGETYWGNVGLNLGLWSTPGGAANTKDTVENVFIQSPSQGVWTVTVSATEINQDSHVETLDFDADFALVVTGAPLSVCPGDFNRDGALTAGDMSDYFNAWYMDQVESTDNADLDGDGSSTATDVTIMLNRYFMGC